jgi:hypothetical protein
MKFHKTKFREIIISYFAKFVSSFREISYSKKTKQCCCAGRGMSRIIFVTLFYIIKWWRYLILLHHMQCVLYCTIPYKILYHLYECLCTIYTTTTTTVYVKSMGQLYSTV